MAENTAKREKNLKKVEKTFKKGIDKRERVWYNNQAVAQSGSKWSLKIEQQEMKYKTFKSMCNGSRTIQTRILLKQK